MTNQKPTADELLNILNKLSEDSINQSSEDFIQTLPEKVCQYLSVPVCIIWIKDDLRNVYKVLATSGNVDNDYQKTELDINHPGVQFPSNKKVFYLSDITSDRYRLADKEKLIKIGWTSLLSSPVKIQQQIIGIIDIFTQDKHRFTSWQKNLLVSITNCATLSFQNLKLNQENLEQTEKLSKLTQIMLDISNASKIDDLYQLLLEGALELVTPAKIIIFCLDYRTGNLKSVKTNSKLNKKTIIKYGQGFISKALEKKEPILINNIKPLKGKNIYIPFWKDTEAELAIPILIDKVQVRVGTNIEEGSKPIGVLNLESNQINTFSETDKNILWSLARHVAIKIESIRTEKKIRKLRRIEQKIANERDSEQIIQAVISGITKTLDFELVNISLVNQERTRIKTDYVVDIPQREVKNFKRMADHSLTSKDIQADIVRKKEIEVISSEDKRFDQRIFKKFNHERLIRVFIPMIEAVNNQVMGILEAGYDRKYRQYIYEWDVQLLESFVNVAVQALERKKSGWLDRITHELRSPIVGIRGNVSFLQRRMNQIGTEKIYLKFEDIQTDCSILLYQVRQLEYFLGGRIIQKPKLEDTFILRDIIIKTTHQLKSLINEYKLPFPEINYGNRSSRSVVFYTDKAKLNQVVYNLLINAIKYSNPESNNHKISIDIHDTNKSLIIKFKDWGIGIRKEDKDKIFDFGFRCPEAINKNVTGSGLGLSISKDIMKGLGGDLQLIHNYNPTEFHVILYKKGDE